MQSFKKLYAQLNSAQREAVDTIDGPLLVIAGPGTGKTQLLSARVANILERTDAQPQNILCLTFTESGAANMRERLSRFIGKAAYDVHIGTYHAFGGDLIQRFPQYFTETRLESPIDELGKYQIIHDIVAALPYSDALKQTQHHLGDLIATISELKRALITPTQARKLAAETRTFLDAIDPELATIFDGFTKMPGTYDKAAPYFVAVEAAVHAHLPPQPADNRFGSLAHTAHAALVTALGEAADTNKSKPLTAWKNDWLSKNNAGQFILSGRLETRRLESLGRVLQTYQDCLESKGLYDFDDMILRAINALGHHAELRFSLQEQYLYILLDEYQDTNAAQAKLVQLLTDSPSHEGRPNVMAVGDDDQAIYAFQGAQYSNMLDFYRAYRGVHIVNLDHNYRSTAPILATAAAITSQIQERLSTSFESLTKSLVPAATHMPATHIERRDFQSDVAQYAYAAERINELIRDGVNPSEIAVLAPKHAPLAACAAHLMAREIPVKYEKRENILETPIIREILALCRLLQALHDGNDKLADQLWPQVLSSDYWQIPTATIWQTTWSIRNTDHGSWSQALLDHDDPSLRSAAVHVLHLASKVGTMPVEQLLEYAIGAQPMQGQEDNQPYTMPLQSYVLAQAPDVMYDAISQLSVLRARLRDHQQTRADIMLLSDLLSFVQAYAAAEQPMLNTSPYHHAADAVQLLTVYKAKGMEFAHVFMLSVTNDLWGKGKGGSNKLTLPRHLAPIRHSGSTEDERLRLLFVAITRAKHGLYMLSNTMTYSGSSTTRLKYLDEQQQPDGTIRAMSLPEAYQTIITDDYTAPTISTLQTDWRSRHMRSPDATLQQLLQQRLESYQLSPTDINSFIDLRYAGPDEFFLRTLLHFRSAPTPQSEYGTVIHQTLQWAQNTRNSSGTTPDIDAITDYFSAHLQSRRLPAAEQSLLLERGTRALQSYLSAPTTQFHAGSIAEQNFRSEGAFAGNAHLSGKIDRIDIDRKNRTITVVDYKTSKPHTTWSSDASLHLYKLQLYSYKVLIEASHSYRGYQVTTGVLSFVEPDQQGDIHQLSLTFDDTETTRVQQLMQAIWQRIHALDFPNTSTYSKDLRGIKAFEQFLLTENAPQQ